MNRSSVRCSILVPLALVYALTIPCSGQEADSADPTPEQLTKLKAEFFRIGRTLGEFSATQDVSSLHIRVSRDYPVFEYPPNRFTLDFRSFSVSFDPQSLDALNICRFGLGLGRALGSKDTALNLEPREAERQARAAAEELFGPFPVETRLDMCKQVTTYNLALTGEWSIHWSRIHKGFRTCDGVGVSWVVTVGLKSFSRNWLTRVESDECKLNEEQALVLAREGAQTVLARSTAGYLDGWLRGFALGERLTPGSSGVDERLTGPSIIRPRYPLRSARLTRAEHRKIPPPVGRLAWGFAFRCERPKHGESVVPPATLSVWVDAANGEVLDISF